MEISEVISKGFGNFLDSAGDYGIFITLLFFTVVITIYGVFVFYFYKNLARKDIVYLNLKQYNTSEHPVFSKFLAVFFYIIEYIILLPILTFIWFGVLSIFLLVLSKIENVATILTVSAALIASVRISSSISQALSQDLAKILPFTLLAFFLLEPNFFSIQLFIQRISQIPSLISQVPYYLLFIIGLELIVRFVDLIEKVFASRNVKAEGD